MLAAVATGAGHPAVAALLGLGAAGLAGAVVAMAWSVHTRQIRLAEQLARRQFIMAAGPGAAGHTANGSGGPGVAFEAAREVTGARAAPSGAASPGGAPSRGAPPVAAPPVAIDGPDTVVTGEQARYRVLPANGRTVVSWAVGGGSVSQSPDPAHPGELLLIADQPGNLTIIVRVREGLAERRATKPVTAVAAVTAPAPPFTLRLFLNGWGLITVAVLIIGFAGALDALGSLTSSDFIALAALLAALLGMVAVARGTGDASCLPGKGTAKPKP
jgi:hypothetical protein